MPASQAEQPLDQARGRDRTPAGGRRRGSPRTRRAARARPAPPLATEACARTRSITSASGISNGRSTFIDTCATSPPSWTPIARTPGRPSAPPSRISEAIRRASATVAGGASWRLNATSGARAATSVAPAVGCRSRRPEVGATARPWRSVERAERRRRSAAARGCRSARRARRRGTPGPPARGRCGRRSRAPRRRPRRGMTRRGRRPARRRALRREDAQPRGVGASESHASRRSARPPRRRLAAARRKARRALRRACRPSGDGRRRSGRPGASTSPLGGERRGDRPHDRGVAPLGDVGDGHQKGRRMLGGNAMVGPTAGRPWPAR